jgi:pentose-5-phosphate-3-epimerase
MERLARRARCGARREGKFLIEVDGGIKAHNAPEAVAAGADVLVAGLGRCSASATTRAAIRALRG